MTKNVRHQKKTQNWVSRLFKHVKKHDSKPAEPSTVLAQPPITPATPPTAPAIGEAGTPTPEAVKSPNKKAPGRWQWALRIVLLLALFVILAGIIVTGVKVMQVYGMLQAVNGDIGNLEKLNPTALDSASLAQAGSVLDKTHQDLDALRVQIRPLSGLGPVMGWVPIYGGDLKYSGDLMELGSDLTLAGSQTCKTAIPILQSMDNQGNLQVAALSEELLNAQSDFSNAKAALGKAEVVRQRIDLNALSPKTAGLLKRIDAYAASFNDGLSLVSSMPMLMGESPNGPQTYLILIQNEDELRATGGFITAVGKVVVQNGRLIRWNIADSYSVDDIHKAYPSAPWQIQSYMNIPITTFRDANWSPDFPTTVLWARYLYRYKDDSTINGVIAIDQHVLKTLLSITGPLFVSEINSTVSSDNVEQIMRLQKIRPPTGQQDPNWSRKQFMAPVAEAIINKISAGQGISWEQMLKAMTSDLDQRHILVVLDDPAMSKLLTSHGWDGSVARSNGDFLMAVDTNVGYNKTNAVTQSSLAYDVDLTDPVKPASNLTVVHHNSSQAQDNRCMQWPTGIKLTGLDYWYPIDRCYYDYLRLYLPAGTQLTSATPQAVSQDVMNMLKVSIPARVDSLDDELQGLQGFGTLLVTPMGQSQETNFQFDLPAGILTSDLKLRDLIYELTVQKQAGTDAVPVTVRVHLPKGSQVRSVSPGDYVTEGNNLLFDLHLSTDIHIRIEYHPG